MIYSVEESRKKLEYGLTVGGFPLLAEKPENESLAARDWKEGYKTTYTHKTFGLYSALSMEAQQDELHGIIERLPAAMARAVDATLNYGDGQALLSASHPLLGGGTSTNTPSTAADLTATSFWGAIKAFYEMLDDESKPVRNSPSNLLIPHNSEQKAIELLLSDKYPESAWPYWIGSVDNDCWFLLGDKGPWGKNYPLKWYWRMRPETESDNDFFTKEFMYSCVLRFSCGYTDWRFVYGSMGA
jgi:hypothetical protein